MKLIYFLVFFLLISSCNNKEKSNENPTPESNQGSVVEESSKDGLMEKIDGELSNFSRVESLIYSKEDGSSINVTAYLNKKDQITKIEEEVIAAGTGLNSRTYFYLNEGVLFASKKLSEKVKGNTAYFSEEVSFYSPTGEVTQSKERTSDFEEYINQEDYREISAIKHSEETALSVLKQEGHFAVTFQGFVDSGPYHFLIVGENVKKDGYSSAISIQQDDATIRYLRNEGKDAIGKELQVQFVKHMDDQGYIMQILNEVAIVERKK